jgi:site-specific DNA-methyltransferase (adenine-specific)
MYNEWATPQEFYDAINARFGFTCDVCALPENAKHKNYYTPDVNGLVQAWSGVCWMNPPYNNVPVWVEKAYQESQRGITVVALLASRSSETVWWHNYVMRASEIWFVKNRLHFAKGGIRSRSNHASTIVIFTPFCSGPPVTSQINTLGQFIGPERQQPSFDFIYHDATLAQ